MIQFLRLFSQFRVLEDELRQVREALQSTTTEKLQLQDRLDAVMEDRSKLWEMTQECVREERKSYQIHVNRQWVEHGLGVPYPESPAPESHRREDASTEPISRPRLPSEAIQARKTAFLDQYKAR